MYRVRPAPATGVKATFRIHCHTGGSLIQDKHEWPKSRTFLIRKDKVVIPGCGTILCIRDNSLQAISLTPENDQIRKNSHPL